MKLVMMLCWATVAGIAAGTCQAAKPVKQPPTQGSTSTGDLALEALVAEPKEWSSFDWSKAAEHRVFKDQRWQRRADAKVQSNGKVISSELEARVQGDVWRVLRWDADANGGAPVMLTMSRDLPYSECQSAAARYGKDLAQPVANDNSLRTYTSEEHYVTSLMTSTQWVVGSTVIQADCIGFTSTFKMAKDKPDEALLNVSIQPLASTKVMAKNFTLRCSRKLKIGASGEERQIEDMALLVSPNEPFMIRSPNLASQSASDEKVMIDDLTIRFVSSTKVGKVAYLIDRVTGSLSAEVKDNGRYVATVMGKCEKATSATLF